VYVKSETNLLTPFHFSLKYIPMWHLWHMYVGGEIDFNWVKAWKKEPQSVWTILKKKHWIFEKSLWNTVYQKNCLILKVLILSKLQLEKNYENSPCFKSVFTCLKHSRKVGGHVIFLFQNFFSLRNIH